MKRLTAVIVYCTGLACGLGAAVAGAAPSDQSAIKECQALKKEIGSKSFKARFSDPDGRRPVQVCRAEMGGAG